MYGQRNFMIIEVSDLGLVDFTQVLETSPETVRKSVDGTKTFLKWEGDGVPSSIAALPWKQGPLSYEEMLALLATPEWTKPFDLSDMFGSQD
jgi:hypothetical protein